MGELDGAFGGHWPFLRPQLEIYAGGLPMDKADGNLFNLKMVGDREARLAVGECPHACQAAQKRISNGGDNLVRPSWIKVYFGLNSRTHCCKVSKHLSLQFGGW